MLKLSSFTMNTSNKSTHTKEGLKAQFLQTLKVSIKIKESVAHKTSRKSNSPQKEKKFEFSQKFVSRVFPVVCITSSKTTTPPPTLTNNGDTEIGVRVNNPIIGAYNEP